MPQQRTCDDRNGMSTSCQYRKSRPYSITSSAIGTTLGWWDGLAIGVIIQILANPLFVTGRLPFWDREVRVRAVIAQAVTSSTGSTRLPNRGHGDFAKFDRVRFPFGSEVQYGFRKACLDG
jgi:hypothetical protein